MANKPRHRWPQKAGNPAAALKEEEGKKLLLIWVSFWETGCHRTPWPLPTPAAWAALLRWRLCGRRLQRSSSRPGLQIQPAPSCPPSAPLRSRMGWHSPDSRRQLSWWRQETGQKGCGSVINSRSPSSKERVNQMAGAAAAAAAPAQEPGLCVRERTPCA